MKEIEHGTEKGAKQHHRRGRPRVPDARPPRIGRGRLGRTPKPRMMAKPSPTEVLGAAEKDAAVARILAYLGSR